MTHRLGIAARPSALTRPPMLFTIGGHRPGWRDRWREQLIDDRGAATAEFAVVTMAAVGFAGLLVLILRSDEVRGILTELVRSALSVAG